MPYFVRENVFIHNKPKELQTEKNMAQTGRSWKLAETTVMDLTDSCRRGKGLYEPRYKCIWSYKWGKNKLYKWQSWESDIDSRKGSKPGFEPWEDKIQSSIRLVIGIASY